MRETGIDTKRREGGGAKQSGIISLSMLESRSREQAQTSIQR